MVQKKQIQKERAYSLTREDGQEKCYLDNTVVNYRKGGYQPEPKGLLEVAEETHLIGISTE